MNDTDAREGAPPAGDEERTAAGPAFAARTPGSSGSKTPSTPATSRASADRRPGERRALAHQGGEVEAHGDRDAAAMLSRALEAAADQPADALTHGFHAYPARMHPAIARSLVAEISTSGDRILDPFCGSGTVLLEAMVSGRRGAGVDLNPLALRIAETKTAFRGQDARERFLSAAHEVATKSEERVRSRTPAVAQIPRHEVSYYAPHILKELAGLYEEIASIEDATLRGPMKVIFSANLVKCSNQRADTAERETSRSLRKGLPTEWFARKAQELTERWAAVHAACTEQAVDPVRPLLLEGDARRLHKLLEGRAADLLVTSPPYGGTYDYVEHHARRYPWLGLSARQFARDELGARRHLSHGDAEQASLAWDEEVTQMLRAMRRATRPGSRIVLLVGDAQLGAGRRSRRVDAAEQLRRLAPETRLQVVASASQRRPDWTEGDTQRSEARERREHLVMLTPLQRG